MDNIKIVLRELDRHGKFVQNIELNLKSIPRKDEKISLDIEGIGYVFQVNEVVHAEAGLDIYAQRIGSITDFEGRFSSR